MVGLNKMSNYSDSKFVSHPNTPWYKVLKMIPVKSRVLDIGCSSGNFGKVLISEKQTTVDGIELDPDDAKLAEKVLNKVQALNVETDDISMFEDSAYDIIYFGDVIEHLVDPVKVLKKVKAKLAPEGAIIFSIPNMTHITVRIMLMSGRFSYGRTGLLDNTHLHYYDLNEIKRVFSEAGFTINELDWVTRGVPEELLRKQLKEIGLTADAKFIKRSKETESIAYQYIGEAKLLTKKSKPTKLPAISPPIDDFDNYLSEVRQEYEKVITKLNNDEKRTQKELIESQRTLAELINSTSWKLTKPLRTGNKMINNVTNKKNRPN
jgi:2-polyprenyl-3-methyl-5-hydroxy-6-metoxy-1,4-benzoquinol methylase